MKAEVVAVIFARAGSKGVPGKNIRPLAGKPLLAHAIEAAQAVNEIDRVMVSTDSPQIAEVARKWGAEVPFLRPAELARDDAPEWLAWRHAVEWMDAAGLALEAMVSVPTTAPLRLPSDVRDCLLALLGHEADGVITVTPAARNPYFNMVFLDDNGLVRRVIESGGRYANRQSAPPVFDITTVAYAVRPDLVRRANSLFEGRLRAVRVPPERALDIDTELDFKFAEFLMRERKAMADENPA